MNKILKALLITIVVVIVLLVIGRVGYWELHYDRDGIVTEVSDDLITITDICGNEWCLVGDQLSVGDRVTMRMNTRGTEATITDDSIESWYLSTP